MALDYSDTGDFLILGNELSILETPRRLWNYTRKINSSWPGSGNPYFKSVLNVAYANTTQDPDTAETASKNALTDEMEEDLRSVHERRKSTVLDAIVLPYLAKKMQLDQGTIDEGPFTYEYDQELLSSTGQVSVSRRGGILGKLYSQMSADSESIRVNGVTIGAIAALPGGRSHALSGRLTMHCVDDTVGRTLLTLDLVLDEKLTDGTETRGADNRITVDTDYEDGPTGVTLQIRYVDLVETGDNGNVLSAPDWDQPNEDDGDKGKLYLRLTRIDPTPNGGNNWLWEWFKNANRAVEELVGSRMVTGTSGSVPVAIPGTRSNLSFTFDKAAAATLLPAIGNQDSDLMLDLKVPRFGDTWTKTVTNDYAGLYATKIAKTWPVSLNVATNPSQTIPDTLAPDFAIAAV
jgi:hypothetical protein